VAHPPPELRSQNGVLEVHFSFRTSLAAGGDVRFCYLTSDGSQAPTLRLQPGDLLVLHFKNDLPPVSTAMPMHSHDARPGACTTASAMTAASTNLHFHGLVIPPTCHQDETVTTLLPPSSPEFEYRFRVPKDHPPGLYWYHPHPHGFSEAQVLGGASGAMIIEGIERANPLVSGLPERLLIVRDQRVESPATKPDPNRPGKDLSLNFVPVSYPGYTPAVLNMKVGQREFWRVLNASADTYLDLQVLFGGKPQYLGVVGLDGVPIRYGTPNAEKHILWESHVLLPPAGRAEFVVNGPATGVDAQLITQAVETGPPGDADAASPASTPAADDDNTPSRPLARILVKDSDGNDGGADPSVRATSVLPVFQGQPENDSSFPPLAEATPVRQRRIYFSEKPRDPKNPNATMQFFITEEGHTPKVFDSSSGVPDIVVHQGDVEDWLIENRSSETHAFHIHQTHFLILERHGVPVREPYLRDTINVPYWDGFTPDYPSIKLRLDFRDPAIVGTFPYHCHILQHEDGGMMGLIRVEPAEKSTGPAKSNSAKTPAGR
jgi:FtsP/CotA-like multicopper oxidase with cupredoxin domain